VLLDVASVASRGLAGFERRWTRTRTAFGVRTKGATRSSAARFCPRAGTGLDDLPSRGSCRGVPGILPIGCFGHPGTTPAITPAIRNTKSAYRTSASMTPMRR